MPKVLCLVTNEIGENCYIIGNGALAAVIDPGGCAEEIENLCAQNGYRITDILLTHGHFDHIEAVAELKAHTGAAVRISLSDSDMLMNTARSLGNGAWHTQCPPDAILPEAQEQSISAAGMDFTVLHTPGHTSGSVCYYLENDGLLFSGDTLFLQGFGRTDFPTGSPLALRNSLRLLFNLPGNTQVFPGHGSQTTIGNEAFKL